MVRACFNIPRIWECSSADKHAQIELFGIFGIAQFFQARFFLTDDQDPLVEIFGLAADQGILRSGKKV